MDSKEHCPEFCAIGEISVEIALSSVKQHKKTLQNSLGEEPIDQFYKYYQV